eukprot:m.4149 g.4149  ORF g.4149 m.4149 type:complete len:290 (+) comp10299_c0_seq1:67-936(+)
MFKLLSRFLLGLLIVLPVAILTGPGGIVARAEEDEIVEEAATAADEDDDETTVEEDKEDGEETKSASETAGDDVTGEGDEEEEEVPEIKPSPDADTNILFTAQNEKQLPSGKLIKVLVGFQNNGDQDFIVDNLDASLRFPQDYTYFIQNFTLGVFDTLVPPNQHRSFYYQFMSGDNLGGRSFILTLLLNYKSAEGSEFRDALFNQTVEFYEIDEFFDVETFFLYVLFSAALGLVVFVIYQYMPSANKHRSSPKTEVGTQGDDEVDKSWLPMDHLNGAPGKSPRKRKTKS